MVAIRMNHSFRLVDFLVPELSEINRNKVEVKFHLDTKKVPSLLDALSFGIQRRQSTLNHIYFFPILKYLKVKKCSACQPKL